VAIVGGLLMTGVAVAYVLDLMRSREQTIALATQTNETLVRTLEGHIHRVFQSTDLVLAVVAEMTMRDTEFQIAEHPATLAYLNRRIERLPHLTNLFIADAQGVTIHRAGAPGPVRINIADRHYFHVHRQARSERMHRGEITRDPSSDSWTLPLSRRIEDERRVFAGAVVAFIDPSHLAEIFDRVDSPQDTVITLADTAGNVVARYPDRFGTIGSNIAQGQLFRDYVSRAPEGTYITGQAFDGMARLMTYATVPDYGLVIASGMSEAVMLRSWRTQAIERGFAAGAVMLALAFLSAMLIRELRRREATEADVTTLSTMLQRRTAQFEAALHSMDEGLVLYDRDQRLTLLNRRYTELYNLPPGAVRVGMTLREVMELSIAVGNYDGEYARQVLSERLAVAAANEARTFNQRLANGRVVEVRHQPLESGGFVATYVDTTGREAVTTALRAAKEQAELASRSKTEFLANVSHELRTPLNAIIGFAEVLHREYFGKLTVKQRDYVGDIHTSGRHLLQLINDILDLAKVEAGKVDLSESDIDIAELIEQSIQLVTDRPQSARPQALIPPGFPCLRGDDLRVKQIIVNLLSNAVKFTPSTGTVQVGASVDEQGGIVITVRDTGIGMRPEDIERMLEPFEQVDSALTRQHEGTGLGLPLTRKFVELHQGTLSIESAPGRGTTVTVRFPPARTVAQTAPRRPAAASA